MPGKMVLIFGAWNVLWTLLAASQAFKIETTPEFRTLAQIGDSVSLTCSTTGCEAPSFSWRTQIDSPLNGKVRSEGTKSTLTMDPVSFANEHSYLCTATCEPSGKLEREIQVEIYSFPKDPEIHFSGPLEAGKPTTVKCLVPDVYPFDRLEMDLLKGGHLLKNQDFLGDVDKKSLETKSLEVTFTPVIEDTGKALVCQARLYFDSVPKVRETMRELQVYISPKNTDISVNPSTTLQEGGSVTMTCSSEGEPAPHIFWNKKLDDGKLQLLSGNATLTLIAMRMEDSGIYACEGINLIGKDRKEVELIVQEKPFTVQISPGPRIVAQIGDSVVLTCGVTGCESPSFHWRTQIDSPLSGKLKSEGTKSTLTLSPVSFENEHSYLCTVTCGRRRLEKEIQVELYSFSRDPEIEMSGLLVNGNPVTVTCKVPNVYPFDRLEIELLKGDTILKNENFLEELDRKSLETKSLEMTFIPTTEDTGKVLVCQAKLQIDGLEFEPKQRKSTQTLFVNVAPNDTTILVSPSSILEEGSSVTMTCSSDGLPAPKILWSRQLNNGALQPLSENATLTLNSTKKEDSGIYVCDGINQAGTNRKAVELIIQVAPKDINLTAFPSESIKEGDSVTISCTCGNVPETWIILKKKAETGDTVLKSIDGAYIIRKAQLEDAGVYECESKNELGSQLKSLTLAVKERETHTTLHPALLMLYCASSLIIPAIGMIVYFARRANMRGSYSLVEAQKSKV
ncbi:vascular cell adhesion protein 1 isoform X1 [Otolemur garnettii]|uniref:Vascular cell adhesion protein 1 n=1 Tax=Otolemur garnettii TaxID=30611 RepID=H0XCK5_OTOGA|nr:vascular cell adhesion protein 1 isoform X1 [Otolemur garnettii]XP_023365675.1 vascular cell adhesion protein 1 isoform X1 [Otolemur garnettii]XP_023365676.1 vascular cell adhesion protein 1 isoform X1 [Otolemur garnettii]XP_023365677.1 vascular cell adhesion protein 1 isoform X1 [Otolemur garnettii]